MFSDEKMLSLVESTIGELGDGWVNPVVAEKVAAYLREQDPEFLREWLDEHAEVVLTDWIGNHFRYQHNFARAKAKKVAFAEAAGDPSLLGEWMIVNAEGAHRRVADMAAGDHLFVAGQYRASSKRDALYAKFHKAVAQKIGDKTTGEVFDEEAYDKMLASITGGG